MSKKIFGTLFILSILAIVFGEDGMIKSFSFLRFGIPFMFISFPFLLAYFFDWKKGFSISILTSVLVLLLINYFFGLHSGEDWTFIYNIFFALFSLWYLILSFIVSLMWNKYKKSSNIIH